MAIKAIDIRSSTTAKDNKNTLRAGLNLKIFKINYSVNYENETDSKTYESLCSLITDQSGE